MTALHVRCNALHKYGASRGPEGSTEATQPHTSHVPQSRSQSGITALQAEGEGFEPSNELTPVNGFRDRTELPARPHHSWSLGPGGMQGEMNLSRRIRATHRHAERNSVALTFAALCE